LYLANSGQDAQDAHVAQSHSNGGSFSSPTF
jgi:hypothetical protein